MNIHENASMTLKGRAHLGKEIARSGLKPAAAEAGLSVRTARKSFPSNLDSPLCETRVLTMYLLLGLKCGAAAKCAAVPAILLPRFLARWAASGRRD